MEKYRLEADGVYEYSSDQSAYVFVGKLNGRSLEEFINDREDKYLYHDSDDEDYEWEHRHG